MARENINAGAGTLAAMSNNVAQMGALRNQSNALMMEHLNNFTQGLQKWQKDFDERKRVKWAQEMEQAKFDEQKRINDAQIDLANAENHRAEQKLPTEIDLLKAQAGNTRANAYSTSSQTKHLNIAHKRLNDYEQQAQQKQAKIDADKERQGLGRSTPADATRAKQITQKPFNFGLNGTQGTTLGFSNPIKRQ